MAFVQTAPRVTYLNRSTYIFERHLTVYVAFLQKLIAYYILALHNKYAMLFSIYSGCLVGCKYTSLQWRAHISIKVQNLLWRNHNWDSTYWALMVEYYVLLTVSCLCSISILSANECLHDQLNMYGGGAPWARATKNVQKPLGWKRKNL